MSRIKSTNILVQNEVIDDQWKEYLDELFNGCRGETASDILMQLMEDNREFIKI